MLYKELAKEFLISGGGLLFLMSVFVIAVAIVWVRTSSIIGSLIAALLVDVAVVIAIISFWKISLGILGITMAVCIWIYINTGKTKARIIMEEEAESEEKEMERRESAERREALNLIVPKTSENDKVYLIGGEKRRDFQTVNGVKNGYETVYYPSGNINKRQYYENGALTGEAITYYPDGQAYIVAHYVNNDLNGHYTIYNQDGSILGDRIFKDGERVA